MKNAESSKMYASYIGTSVLEQEQMLEEIGMKDYRDLFSEISAELFIESPVDIEGPYSEEELVRIFKKISLKNKVQDVAAFLGGGVRQVYIPAFLEELMRRGEIYTAYTSYQPEVAQGLLQLVFEYESQLAELTGMDVISASMYDWASALGELARMMIRIKRKRSKVLVLEPISPHRLAVLESYLAHPEIGYIRVQSVGDFDFNKAVELIREDTNKVDRELAGIYFEAPNYHGVLSEHVDELVKIAHSNDLLVGVGVDVISLGILRPPGEYGADFIIGEGQLLGNGLSSGGPLLGIIGATYNRKHLQNFPGRLVGVTKDFRDKETAYCITLSTREQHIRRERATSNICTNQTLMAVNAGIYLASLGPKGIKELAVGLVSKANYTADKLNEISSVIAPVYKPFFSEFVTIFENTTHSKLEQFCLKRGIIPGIRLDGAGCRRLISVSDLIKKKHIDRLIDVIKEMYSNEN